MGLTLCTQVDVHVTEVFIEHLLCKLSQVAGFLGSLVITHLPIISSVPDPITGAVIAVGPAHCAQI